jgi:hypothetical protein
MLREISVMERISSAEKKRKSEGLRVSKLLHKTNSEESTLIWFKSIIERVKSHKIKHN